MPWVWAKLPAPTAGPLTPKGRTNLMRKSIRTGLFFFLCFSSIWHANGLLAADGSSGCGPGWWVFKDKTILSSAVRFVSHVTFWPSTVLGMTSGTSNCSKHSLVLKDKRALHLAIASLEPLKGEISRGAGQHLNALAVTMDCPWQAQDSFNRALRANFRNLVPSEHTTADDFVRNVQETVLTTPDLAAQCLGSYS